MAAKQITTPQLHQQSKRRGLLRYTELRWRLNRSALCGSLVNLRAAILAKTAALLQLEAALRKGGRHERSQAISR
jgi:hypothetical protein